MRRRQMYAVSAQQIQPRKEVILNGNEEKAHAYANAAQGQEAVLAQNVSCPKCGKSFGRGAHFHIRACKG